MSRLVALFLLLVFTGDTALPFFADPQASLPACCRRGGKHHCAMLAMYDSVQPAAGPSATAVQPKCPLFPKGPVACYLQHSAPPQVSVFGSAVIEPFISGCLETRHHTSHNRAHCERGPPALG